MTPFEDELRKALARRDPSPDFTARLFERLHEAPTRQSRPEPWFSWRWVAVAATVVLVVCGLLYRREMRQQRGEAAKQQLILAMRIAGTELHEAQLRVKRIQFPEVVNE